MMGKLIIVLIAICFVFIVTSIICTMSSTEHVQIRKDVGVLETIETMSTSWNDKGIFIVVGSISGMKGEEVYLLSSKIAERWYLHIGNRKKGHMALGL